MYRQQNRNKERLTSQLHCVNCGTLSLTILPCPKCPDVQFCSTTCLRQNLQGCHRYECNMRLYGILRVVNKNIVDGLSVGKIMALRLVTQKPPTFFIQYQKEFEELLLNEQHKNNTNEINHFSLLKTEGYHAMLNLACAPLNASKKEKQDNFAVALLWLLRNSSYFSDLKAASNHSYNQLKSLLLRLIIKVKH